MATPNVWSNVQIAVQSAVSASQTITGITKASPGVVTYTGNDPTNGDYVIITAVGMWQLDARVCRIANVSAGSNTFELEGINTTDYDTFTSGSFEIVTLGTSLSVVTDVQASGGDFQMIDVTTIHDNVQKQIPGTASPVTFNLTCLWDMSDAGLAALKTKSDSRALVAIRFTFANGSKFVFLGYVGCALVPTGSGQQKVATPVTFTAYGKPNAYSS